jgi:hypothetical protein
MSIFDSISLSLGHRDASGVYLISVRNGDWIIRYPEKKISVISLTPSHAKSHTNPAVGLESDFSESFPMRYQRNTLPFNVLPSEPVTVIK